MSFFINYNQSVSKADYNIDHWCDYNDDASNKIISLVSNIFKYKDNSTININIKESNISIQVGSIGNIKGNKYVSGITNPNYGTVTISSSSTTTESYLEINLMI